MANSNKLGGNIDICSVCQEKVYPTDKFVIEKVVLHKNCFKCKHCSRKLSLTNFAAVNGQVYCKVHYLKLFKESGGKYDKAFGDGGFQKKTVSAYTPQFTGIGKSSSPPSALPTHIASGDLQMSPVIAPKLKPTIEQVSKFKTDDDDDNIVEEKKVVKPSNNNVEDDFKIGIGKKSSVKEIMKKYEASLRDASSGGSEQEDSDSPPEMKRNIQGNIENRMKWLTGISSQHIKKHSEVDTKSLGTVAQRKAVYLAGLESSSEPEPLTSSSTSKLAAEDDYHLHGNLENRLKWMESLISATHIKRHGEVDTTPGGTAAERKQAYLANISPISDSSPSSSGKKSVVSSSISEKMKLFDGSSPSESSSKQPSSVKSDDVGKIDQKLKEFVNAASSSSKTTQEQELIHEPEPLSVNEEGRERTNAYVSPIPTKLDVGQGGAPIRSFNEGANAGLRRTPSWLRQQRALEEAAKASTEESIIEKANNNNVHNNEEEETTLAPTTPEKNEEPIVLTSSIMKRTGSFKKEKSSTPAEKRVVRFGNAEIHNLPNSPRSPDVSDGMLKGAASGHSASKGSAMAAYLKVVENGVRKRPLEEVEQQHTSHSDSPPPPILSPGSRSPNATTTHHHDAPLSPLPLVVNRPDDDFHLSTSEDLSPSPSNSVEEIHVEQNEQ